MSTTLRALPDIAYETKLLPNGDVGKPGALKMIPVTDLMIDDSYQRAVEESGRRNIRRIVEKFRWHLFAPVIVSPRGRSRFAVIDGQHRAAAARLHGGIKALPCWVLNCTPEEEAESFSVINGMITRVSTQALFKARLAAGDKAARDARDAAKDAGVTLLPYPVAASAIKLGETMAVGTIEECVRKYGRDIVTSALRLVVETGDGHRGLVRAQLIEALCDAVRMHPKWAAKPRDMARAIDAHKGGLASIWQGATVNAAAERTGLRAAVFALLEKLFTSALGDGGKIAAKTKAELAREKQFKDGVMRQAMVERAKRGAASTNVQKAQAKGKMTAADIAAAVEAFKARGGAVRKLEGGASGDTNALMDWLRLKRGIEVERTRAGGVTLYAVKGRKKKLTLSAFLALADSERSAAGLEPIARTGKSKKAA